MSQKVCLARSVYQIMVPFGVAIILVIILLVALSPTQPGRSAADVISVGLIPDIAGIGDRGFNYAAYQGLLQAESALNVNGTVYSTTSSEDYELQLQNCVEDGNDLCIGVGFLLADPVSNSAAANPGTNFAVVDFTFDNPPSNLRGITFAEEQSGYLAGTLAGMMTESNMVGAIGGFPVLPVVEFMEGYRRGAQCANPQITTVLTYTNTFVDPALGAQVAQAQIAMGVDVIFGVAGPTGSGAILTATQSSVWGIGIDVDEYYSTFNGGTINGSDFLLTSALKKIDKAVYDTIEDQDNGAFSSGNVLYDLAVDGVGLAPFHEADPFVSQAVRDKLEQVRNGLIGGSIDPLGPCTDRKIGLIPDVGGFGDRGFNYTALQGLLRAESSLNVDANLYTATNPSDYDIQVQNCAEDGNDLCIGVGFLLADSISNTAAAYPETNFAVVDFTFNDPSSNVRGLTFAEDQAGYLAGTLAGMMSESKMVGAIGGFPVPAVVDFMEGYRWGAQCANPQVTAVLSYTDSFVDPDLGAQVAQDQIAMGVDVIFNVAGETGNGAILTATQSSVWGIGVDVDQYASLFEWGAIDGSDFLLSSAMKKLDNAVYDTIYDQVNSVFTFGNVHYDLAVDGVGLAPFHETESAVSGSVRHRLAQIERGLREGWINPMGPCPAHMIGLVPDAPDINEQSFSFGAYQGLLQAESDLNIIGTVYTPSDGTDYENQLHDCAEGGNELCIGVGFLFYDPISYTADLYPQTNFAGVDVSFSDPPDNVRGLIFAEDQVGYLAGTLAGMMTESDVVGAVGGFPVPAVVRFLEGYRWGANCVNPQATIVLSYTNTFVDPDLGAQIAQGMITQGADVIFGAAGPTGNGAVLTATQSSVWGIGVDTDQYYSLFNSGTEVGSDFLLTSAMKRLDNAVFDTIDDQINSIFTSGNVLYDLAIDGVGLAPFHETDPFVSQTVRDRLAWVRNGLIEGWIDPLSDCHRYVYLPVLVR